MLFNRPRHHAAGGCMLLEGINVIWYRIGESLVHTESAVPADVPALVLLTTEELEKRPILPGLESVLEHTPAVRSARFCRAEARSGCLSGTLVLPRRGKDGVRAAFGLLVTQNRIVLTDDSASLPPLLHRIAQEKRWTRGTVGQVLHDFFEELIARDLRRLEELEEQAESLEDQVLSDGAESAGGQMHALRKETMALYRYYSQLDDVACRLCENENGFFSETETERFRLFESRVVRLRENAQLLCEYCRQIQSAFQAQIDIRQNHVMQILTIVTTIFLPLTLLTGWYGMNFVNMPELSWKYGYLMVAVVSVAVLALGLWIRKKKKFW